MKDYDGGWQYQVYRWEWQPVAVRDGRGPDRVETNQPDPDFKRRPVGFTARLEPDQDPLLWEGQD